MKSNLKIIAEELGVSIVAVSNALNDKAGVSDELRKAVKASALRNGYDKTVLRSELERRTRNIAVIISRRQLNPVNMTQAFYLQFFSELSTFLQQKGFAAILCILEHNEEDQVIFPALYTQNKIEGVIFLGELKKAYIQQVDKIKLPKVFLDFHPDNVKGHAIVSDNISGSFEITKHLISKGHRRISFVGSVNATSSIQDRYLGFAKAMIESNLEIKPEWILPDRDADSVYIEVKLPKVLPTAFVCNSDRAAYGLAQQLKKLNYKIGEDISIVGFDNDIFSMVCEPQLTTVAVNIREMSLKATELLVNTINNPNQSDTKISVKGAAIFRDSVKTLSVL